MGKGKVFEEVWGLGFAFRDPVTEEVSRGVSVHDRSTELVSEVPVPGQFGPRVCGPRSQVEPYGRAVLSRGGSLIPRPDRSCRSPLTHPPWF